MYECINKNVTVCNFFIHLIQDVSVMFITYACAFDVQVVTQNVYLGIGIIRKRTILNKHSLVEYFDKTMTY